MDRAVWKKKKNISGQDLKTLRRGYEWVRQHEEHCTGHYGQCPGKPVALNIKLWLGMWNSFFFRSCLLVRRKQYKQGPACLVLTWLVTG